MGGVLDFGEADSRVFAESSEHDDGEEGDDGQVPKGADVVHGGRVAEVRIGDASGTILLSCSGDQIDVARLGTALILQNARVEMHRETAMRVVVSGRWGLIRAVTPD